MYPSLERLSELIDQANAAASQVVVQMEEVQAHAFGLVGAAPELEDTEQPD